jgi:peptide chain release factor subunit 1
LKLYKRIPPNGLVIFCGNVHEGGSEKKVIHAFEPYKPLNQSQYLCSNRFYTAPLEEGLHDEPTYGFVVMDGNGVLLGTLSGTARKTLLKVAVDLPNKHSRGGQSALRFDRIRTEKRHNYVRKVAELMTTTFLRQKPIVDGLVLAGCADLKDVLSKSELLDSRLKRIVKAVVDVQCGDENGFSQAIALTAPTLENVKNETEQKILDTFFSALAKNSGKVVYGEKATMRYLEAGAVDALIVHDDLQTRMGDILLTEHLVAVYQDHGCALNFVSDRSPSGTQFVKGFGGMGAILRYAMELEYEEEEYDEEEV